MSVLLQISDPHFGTEQAPVVNALRELVREQSPQVLVLSGDLTQRARRAQFAAARKFVDELQIPQVLAVPGNHDIPLFDVAARLMWPYANYRRAFGKNLEPTLETPDLLVLCVNTTRPWRHVDGEISEKQIARISARLRAASPRQLRLVVIHQPVHVPRASDAHDRVHGHDAAARAWCEAGIDVVMGGHIHLPYVRPLHELLADLGRSAWCVQAGTAVSSRVRREAPNSINLLRYGSRVMPSACIVERWDYTGKRDRFEKVAEDSLALDRA
ncbi:MAG: metallophosphoesterase family protein [Panacagrimonas sp.]